jgi:tetratricopeptide (TPR) repeat protein
MAEYNSAPWKFAAAATSPREQAQELAYEAMEADTPAQAARLVEKALDLDPDCVDAIVSLAGLTADSREELVQLLEQAVAAGERSLGKDFFDKNKGRFFGIMETRPYMRARAGLASTLQRLGRIDEAIRHNEALVELNPNDNQGIRDVLLGQYLLTGNLEGARRLFKQYEGDSSAVFAWSRVLERFLSGNLEEAALALREARSDNRHVAAYLTGKKKLPARLPEAYSPGQESEAIVCAVEIGEAWKRQPQALEWLRRQR